MLESCPNTAQTWPHHNSDQVGICDDDDDDDDDDDHDNNKDTLPRVNMSLRQKINSII